MSRMTLGVAAVALCATSMGGHTETSPADLQQLARDAYVYGYPLVTMEITRRQSTNVENAEETRAPMGQFANLRHHPSAGFRGVVAPNADTLYSVAWLDLSREAMVLELPEQGSRYWMMPMLDAWTNVFANPGARTTGGKAQKYLITGPGWSGHVPKGAIRLSAPTATVWILGRTYSTGTPKDYQKVHALQDQYRLTPLSAYGQSYTPPDGDIDGSIDMKTPPRDQVNALSGQEFFAILAEQLKENPPSGRDSQMEAKLAQVGIVRGRKFDASLLDPQVVEAIDAAPKDALPEIQKAFAKAGEDVNGWHVTKTGEYGTNYLFRAAVAFYGLGANRPQDAIYPTAKTDTEGQPLDASANDYVITFASKDALPPVKGFWSITMYDDQFFFVKNPLDRQDISSRNKLVTDQDGSIELYVQSESPGKEKEANWLPAPDGPFVLMLRMYWPSERPPSILDGSWKPPVIKATPKSVTARNQ